MSLFRCFGCTKVSVQVRGSCNRFVTGYVLYGEQLLAPRPTPKLKDHPLSAVRDCLFNIFWRSLLYPQPEDSACRSDRDPLHGKATVSFVISVCPSVRPHGTARLPLDGFSLNLIFGYFSKICLEGQVSLKSDNSKECAVQEPLWPFVIISRSVLLRVRKCFGRKLCRKSKQI